MSNKRHKENNQLSLTLEFDTQPIQGGCSAVPHGQQRTASFIAFPPRQTHGSSFRDRVIQDLMKTRVMVGE